VGRWTQTGVKLLKRANADANPSTLSAPSGMTRWCTRKLKRRNFRIVNAITTSSDSRSLGRAPLARCLVRLSAVNPLAEDRAPA